MANLMTRISLRNDTLLNWQNSNVVLNKGEVALARLSGKNSDKYEMRIGVGDKTWNQLSDGGIMIPAANVVGFEDAISQLSDAISQLSTSYYETTDINQLTGDFVNGDIAVEKKDIDLSGHQQYTAYRWNEVDGRWAALDGNYSADNVYFPSNMTMTYAFGKYTVPASGSYTLSCGGKSVAAVINDAYAQTKSPAVTSPAISLTTTTTLTGEVGATYTVPKATLTFTRGTYEYASPTNNTGVSIQASKASISCTTEGTSTTNSNALTANNSTFSLAAGTANAKSFTDAEKTYNYSAKAVWTDGDIPKNNIGADDASKQIKTNASNPATATATCKATGQRYGFYGYRLASESRLDFSALTSNDIRNNIHATKWNATNGSWPSSFTVPANSTQIIFAVPTSAKDLSSHRYIKMSNVALGTYYFQNNGLLRTANLSVDGAAANTLTEYQIWTIDPQGAFDSSAVYTIEYGSTQKQ